MARHDEVLRANLWNFVVLNLKSVLEDIGDFTESLEKSRQETVERV
jgi:hypothetical protein